MSGHPPSPLSPSLVVGLQLNRNSLKRLLYINPTGWQNKKNSNTLIFCSYSNTNSVIPGITPRDIDNLPPALALALITIFGECKGDPPTDWSPNAYHLVMREDLALQTEIADTIKSTDEYMECELFVFVYLYILCGVVHRLLICNYFWWAESGESSDHKII